MVSEFMHASPAKLILLSLCFQTLTFVPAFAQVAPADGRVGTPLNAPIASTVAPATASSATPTNMTSYILGPEDQITVRVFAADDIPDKPAQIANDGTVNLPMVGEVHAAGLTVEQLQASLAAAYRKYFKSPQVTVEFTDFRSQPVSVAGNVNTPGVVQLRGTRNLMEVIGMAGGLKPDAGDSVLITRSLNQGSIPVAGAFVDATG